MQTHYGWHLSGETVTRTLIGGEPEQAEIQKGSREVTS